MKISFILFVCFSVMFSSCSQGKKKYYLKDKWYTSSSSLFPVSGQPKKITEYFYGGLKELDPKELPTRYSYDEFTYNAEGDLLQRKLWSGKDFWHAFIYSYTDSGYQVKMQSNSPQGYMENTVLKFQATANNNFIYKTDFSGNAIKKIYTYKNDGNKLVIEHFKVINGKDSLIRNEITYYNGQLKQKIIIDPLDMSEDKCVQDAYYYGNKNTPDSIIRSNGISGNVIKRDLFVLNKEGDPVSEIYIEFKDTSKNSSYIYQYDEKGNWIRRLEKDNLPQVNYKVNGNSLIIRKIEY